MTAACLECLLHTSCKTNTHFCVSQNVRLIELLSALWFSSSHAFDLIISLSLSQSISLFVLVNSCIMSWSVSAGGETAQTASCSELKSHLITTGQIRRKTCWVTALNVILHRVYPWRVCLPLIVWFSVFVMLCSRLWRRNSWLNEGVLWPLALDTLGITLVTYRGRSLSAHAA